MEVYLWETDYSSSRGEIVIVIAIVIAAAGDFTNIPNKMIQ